MNAFKITGRTAGGLGIGIFNAVTDPADAIIQDSLGHTRRFQTSPYANYNILVLDQNLANNSSVTLINTNVDRFGKDYSADVGGVVFSLGMCILLVCLDPSPADRSRLVDAVGRSAVSSGGRGLRRLRTASG